MILDVDILGYKEFRFESFVHGVLIVSEEGLKEESGIGSCVYGSLGSRAD